MAFLDKINRQKFIDYSEACGIEEDGDHEDLMEERDAILDLIEELDSKRMDGDDLRAKTEYAKEMVDGLDDLIKLLDDFDGTVKAHLGKGAILKRKESVRTLRRRISKTKSAAKSARRTLDRMDYAKGAKDIYGMLNLDD